MDKNLAGDIFLIKKRNCAETLIMAACDYYGLALNDDLVKAVGVFGGGIGSTGRLCGAVAGAVCAIGLKHNTGKARESTEMRDRAASFMRDFIREYGSDLCEDLKPHHLIDGVQCLSIVEGACDILKKHM